MTSASKTELGLSAIIGIDEGGIESESDLRRKNETIKLATFGLVRWLHYVNLDPLGEPIDISDIELTEHKDYGLIHRTFTVIKDQDLLTILVKALAPRISGRWETHVFSTLKHVTDNDNSDNLICADGSVQVTLAGKPISPSCENWDKEYKNILKKMIDGTFRERNLKPAERQVETFASNYSLVFGDPLTTIQSL